jgi:hypothetical protein
MSKAKGKKLEPDDVVVAQCAQCGGPVTERDKVVVSEGPFCSMECREQYEEYLQRLEEAEGRPKPGWSLRYTVRRLIRFVILLALVLVLVGFFAVTFDIPHVTPFYERLLESIGMARG